MDTLTRLLLLCACGLVGGTPLGRLLARRRDLDVYASQYSQRYSPYVYAAIPLHAPVPVLRVLSRAPLRAPRPDAQGAGSALHAQYSRPLAAAEPARYYSHFTQHVQHPPPAQRFDEQARYPDSDPYRPARPLPSPEPDYEASAYDYAREYGAPRRPAAPLLEYAAEYDSYAPQPSPLPQLTYALSPYEAGYAPQEAAPTVLYARRSPSGGYTYRRAPAGDAPNQRKKPALKEKDKIPFIIKIHKYRIVKDDLI